MALLFNLRRVWGPELILPVTEVDNNRFLNQVPDASNKGQMGRILGDIVVPILNCVKLDHEAVGYSVL